MNGKTGLRIGDILWDEIDLSNGVLIPLALGIATRTAE